jgi:hypothetical protein
MIAARSAVRFLFVGGVLALGIWLATPGERHVDESLLSSCRLASGTVARLFEGNGGATTAFWYSVTAESGDPSREREIFFAYAQPVIRSITCEQGRVLIRSASREWTISEASILKGAPSLEYWRGQHDNRTVRQRESPIEGLRRKVGLGMVLLVVALVAARWLRALRAAAPAVAAAGSSPRR